MNTRYDIEYLRKCSERVLVDKGLAEKSAEIVVDSMISADINGVSTHGIRMLVPYLQKIEKGEFSVNSHPSVINQTSAFTVIDAANTIGAISAELAVSIAVEQARKSGIHTVFSRNSNTFGPGFYYAEKIADEGMIGFVCCNAPAAMPAFNGIEAMLGTNPLAYAFPTKSHGHVVMDMATSVVAKSRFGVAKAKGEKLEPGWALDKNGNPTVDPDEGIQGFVLPMAGFKGYGIAMMIDMVSGFLSGAGFLNTVGKFYSKDGACMNVGHMITAFDPGMIYEGDFLADADGYVEKLRNSKTLEGKNVVLPGDDRRQNREISLKEGIVLPEETVEKLESTFGEALKKG